MRVQKPLYTPNIQKTYCSPSFKQDEQDETDPLTCLRDKTPERFPSDLPDSDGRIVLIALAVIAIFAVAYMFGAFNPPQHR